MLKEKIQKRIDELTKSRDELIAEANRQIVPFNVAIGELTQLLAEEKPAETPADLPVPANGGAELIDTSPAS